MYFEDEYPFHTAAIRGDVDAMEVMFTKFGYQLDELNSSGLCPILLAAAHNQVSVISFLLEKGVDINFSDHISGATPLIAAILNGSTEAMVALYEYGCDVSSRDKEGKSPVHIACLSSSKALPTLRWLHSLGCDMNVCDNKGYTPLHTAVKNNQLSCVRALVKEFGAKVHVRAENGVTPLYLAASVGHALVILELCRLDSDCDPNAADDEGTSPCGVAALFGHLDAVRAIHDVGGSCVLPDGNGITPYQDAVAQGHVEIASFLRHIATTSKAVCFVCRCISPQEELLKCLVCKNVAYCSKRCQVIDFRSHKELCREKKTQLLFE